MINRNSKHLEYIKKLNEILIKNSKDFIALLDGNLNFFYINSVFAEIIGYRKESILKKNFKEIIFPEDRFIGTKIFNECDKFTNSERIIRINCYYENFKRIKNAIKR
ncbi:MAG: PAS domain-containing protein [Candidatus Lokiarchaeota archaeon]